MPVTLTTNQTTLNPSAHRRGVVDDGKTQMAVAAAGWDFQTGKCWRQNCKFKHEYEVKTEPNKGGDGKDKGGKKGDGKGAAVPANPSPY